MGLFKPAWQSRKYAKAMKAVNKLSSQTKLACVVAEASVGDAIRVAIEKLTDQTLLAGVVSNREIHDVFRMAAAKKLTDQDLAQKAYTGIANSKRECGEIRLWAADNLTDQALAQQTYVDITNDTVKYSSYRLEAAEKILDQTLAQQVFADIAKDVDSLGSHREKAIELLEDQVVLAEIALSETVVYIRLKAIEKLTDKGLAQRLYADIAIKDDSWSAFDKLTDQACIADVVKQEKYFGKLGEAAIEKLTDQKILADVVLSSYTIKARLAAFEKLTDPFLIAEIAKQEIPFLEVRMAVIKRLETQNFSQELYADIVKHGVKDHDEHWGDKYSPPSGTYDICMTAVRMLTDQAILADLARHSDDGLVRYVAITMITDKAVLTEFANSTDDSWYQCSWQQRKTLLEYEESELFFGFEKLSYRYESYQEDLRETARNRLAELDKGTKGTV